MKDFILRIWIWLIFIRFKDTLPSESNISNPKLEYEGFSGAFIFEDEGLWELRNHHLQDGFKYVINHRMKLMAGKGDELGVMRSSSFDELIYNMAKKLFPNWIGFDKSRCSYNADYATKILRVKKVEKWKHNKLASEQ